MNQIAALGHNMPPLSPFEAAEKEVNDLYNEAALWLDGSKVASQEVADGLGNLLNLIRAAEKRADALRVTEKKPHDDAAAEVQARYKPLLNKTKRASDAIKKAIAGWLAEQERIRQAAAAEARRIADETAAAAREAHRIAQQQGTLEDLADAELLFDAAKDAGKAAARIEKAPVKTGGGIGRAVSLRTVYAPVLADFQAACRHYYQRRPDDMKAWLQQMAERDIRAGLLDIPGFTVQETKVAV